PPCLGISLTASGWQSGLKLTESNVHERADAPTLPDQPAQLAFRVELDTQAGGDLPAPLVVIWPAAGSGSKTKCVQPGSEGLLGLGTNVSPVAHVVRESLLATAAYILDFVSTLYLASI